MQSYNPKLRNFTFLIVILIFAFLFLIWLLQKDSGTANTLDAFAKCLADKGITMYGADWCPHCQNEKKAFGASFKYVPYVECPDEPDKCLAAGIEGYPTWIMKDGRKFEGELGLNKLSELSGCSLQEKPAL